VGYGAAGVAVGHLVTGALYSVSTAQSDMVSSFQGSRDKVTPRSFASSLPRRHFCGLVCGGRLGGLWRGCRLRRIRCFRDIPWSCPRQVGFVFVLVIVIVLIILVIVSVKAVYVVYVVTVVVDVIDVVDAVVLLSLIKACL
jgi:amino acid transporter